MRHEDSGTIGSITLPEENGKWIMGAITAVEAVSKVLKATRSVGDAVHTPIRPIEFLTKSSRNSHSASG